MKYQTDRSARARVLRSHAFVVRIQALFDVVGDAAIQRAVRTVQQIAYPITITHRCHCIVSVNSI